MKKGKKPGRRWRIGCVLLMLAMLPNSTRMWARSLTPEEVASLLGPKTEFTRQEVARLVSEILADADEEIERTAQEAAREVAAVDAGEIAELRDLVASINEELQGTEGRLSVWRTWAVAEAVIILGGMALFALSQ